MRCSAVMRKPQRRAFGWESMNWALFIVVVAWFMMVVLQKIIVAFEHEPRNELHYADRAQIGMIGETLKNNTGDTIKSLRNHGASDGPFLKRHQMYFYILNGSLLRKNPNEALTLNWSVFFSDFFCCQGEFCKADGQPGLYHLPDVCQWLRALLVGGPGLTTPNRHCCNVATDLRLGELYKGVVQRETKKLSQIANVVVRRWVWSFLWYSVGMIEST